jgi:parallel beta-helix repeat protein
MATFAKVFLPILLGFALVAAMLFWVAAGPTSLAVAAHAAPPLQTCACTVSSAADSGIGSLRECLDQAGPSEYICFDSSVFPPTAPATITVVSELPLIVANDLTIDASDAGVVLDGSQLTGGEDGLYINGADRVAIRGLQVIGFPDDGIELCCGASHAVIESNLINGNGACGIVLSNANYNTMVGNLIGTDLEGTGAISNGLSGICVWGSAHNQIGGDQPGKRNLISGNGDVGIELAGLGASYNKVISNYIGTNISGTEALPNGKAGVVIWDGATHNTIGGASGGARNLISGNGAFGVEIGETGTASNTISNNFIGTDITGGTAIPNGEFGIVVEQTATDNIITGNLISGNDIGVSIEDGGSTGNQVANNIIGADASGSGPLPNANEGIFIDDGAQGSLIGPDNIIAFNGRSGVHIDGSLTSKHTVSANSIFDNAGEGILLTVGGNDEIPKPVIVTATATMVSGTAQSNVTVEVFSDNADEGKVYEGSTTSSAGGTWTLSKPSGFFGPYLTATATDVEGNTSEFSDMPFPDPYDDRVSLPLVMYSPICRSPYNNYEPNNYPWQTTTGLVSGVPIQSYICSEDDIDDYFYLDVIALSPITIELTGIPAGVDYDLYLYFGGNPVAGSNNTGNANEKITYTPLQTGRYYIRVHPYPNSKESHSLSPYTLKASFQ